MYNISIQFPCLVTFLFIFREWSVYESNAVCHSSLSASKECLSKQNKYSSARTMEMTVMESSGNSNGKGCDSLLGNNGSENGKISSVFKAFKL